MNKFTEEDLAALNKSLKGGVLEVDYPSGQRVRFQKLSDMLELRDLMIRDINAGRGGGGPALAVLDGDY